MFQYYNPNPKYNGNNKGWRQNDCTVRSLCAALNIDWIKSYNILCKSGLEECVMPHDMIAYNNAIKKLGFKLVKVCKDGELTVKNICILSRKSNNTYLCKCHNHVVCCKNGIIMDTFDSSNLNVERYWIKNERMG